MVYHVPHGDTVPEDNKRQKNHILGSPIAIPSLIKIIHNNEYKNYVISLSSWKIIGLMKLDLGYIIL